MHNHTRQSFDCLSDPERVVQCARERGLDAICITDHNEIDTALRLARTHPDFVIAGEEVKTAEGVDIIGIFLSEKIPRGTPARETCERIRDQGGIVYVPHPFARGKGGDGMILPLIEDLVDAVEGFNARLHDPALNQRAVAWGRARNLPLGGGSDAHTLAEVGRGHVDMPSYRTGDPQSFLASLRDGTVGGSTSPRIVHVASTYAKVHKLFWRATRRESNE